MRNKPGLGELLRYTAELVDQGSAETYQALSINYRPRYTPILRALSAGAKTVTDITTQTHLTQGAISQSVSLMEQDGILFRGPLSDGRMSGLHLTPVGLELIAKLEAHWKAIFMAIEQLEHEVGWPLISVLEATAAALENRGFGERIRQSLVICESGNEDE